MKKQAKKGRNPASDEAPRRGPPKLYPERLLITLPAGSTAAIDAARREDEDRLSLVRAAIEREIRRRGRAAS